MSKGNGDEFVAKAIRYAKAQWCLDDEEVVREWCERRVDSDTPESMVDDAAIRYGLIHVTDDAGAARAASQLLDEYKGEFEELGKDCLAKLPS